MRNLVSIPAILLALAFASCAWADDDAKSRDEAFKKAVAVYKADYSANRSKFISKLDADIKTATVSYDSKKADALKQRRADLLADLEPVLFPPVPKKNGLISLACADASVRKYNDFPHLLFCDCDRKLMQTITVKPSSSTSSVHVNRPSHLSDKQRGYVGGSGPALTSASKTETSTLATIRSHFNAVLIGLEPDVAFLPSSVQSASSGHYSLLCDKVVFLTDKTIPFPDSPDKFAYMAYLFDANKIHEAAFPPKKQKGTAADSEK